MGNTVVKRETEDNAYAKFWEGNKVDATTPNVVDQQVQTKRCQSYSKILL